MCPQRRQWKKILYFDNNQEASSVLRNIKQETSQMLQLNVDLCYLCLYTLLLWNHQFINKHMTPLQATRESFIRSIIIQQKTKVREAFLETLYECYRSKYKPLSMVVYLWFHFIVPQYLGCIPFFILTLNSFKVILVQP